MVDFECPYCRAMNERVEAAIARASGPVELVRKMVPLPIHQNAFAAALAWCCADAQGKGDAMASALFAADPKTLTEEGCAKIAEQIGCDMARYREHMPLAADRVAADLREAKAAKIRGLPTLFIGDQRIEGLSMTTEALLAAIESARG
ncbi:MAG: thioredoxin domain-containing protein [Myxococcota bacterium]|nr:thioredoxin domain-containing protein [Myxococcota bacterium]